MKTKKYLFLMTASVVAMLYSCAPTDTNTCDNYDAGKELCTNDFTANATFCSDGVNNSYYSYNGKKYECTGVDPNTCDAALQSLAADLIADGCKTSKKSGDVEMIKVKLSAFAKNLLEEVRSQSLCN